MAAKCTFAADSSPEHSPETNAFFAQYCNDCHRGWESQGGLDLGALGTDFADAATFAKWERLFDRVQTGEMPPTDSDQPPVTERKAFVENLKGSLNKAHESAKGTVYRRLNRREYQNTMNDLFGTDLDLESTLPEDGRSHEFDNVGASLSVSMVQMRRYLEAADAVMDAAIARDTKPAEASVINANYADTREGEKHIGTAWKQLDDGAVVFYRALGYPTGMLRTANVRKSGRYRISVTGYAHQSDHPITFAIGATTFQRGADRPTFAYRAMPPGKPTTITIEADIDDKYMVELTPWGISDKDYLIKKHGVDAYRGPGLAILNVELTGPIVDEFPSRGHRLIFDGINRREIEPSNPAQKTKSWYVPKFEVVSDNPEQDARQALQRITTKAFRRPVPPAETERYVNLWMSEFAADAPFEEALRTAVAAVFCSPDFLYLREADGRLDDYAVASRLSYFLTRTAPDDPQLQDAEAGRLTSDPVALLKHTRRLLDDSRRERFVTDFTDAWLNLRDLEFTSPDQNLYPEYDQFLLHSMREETRRFFAALIHDNAGVRNLVQSDFAMLNNRLALHYGIGGVDSPEISRVSLSADVVRGGLLTQASVLKVSANGTNTSPVVRGVWVMERILGHTPEPPPPGIP